MDWPRGLRRWGKSGRGRGNSRTRWCWMRITCGARMRRFFGRIRRAMGSEGAARPGFVIREFDAVADAPEVAAILWEAREAASWSAEALRETALLLGVAAFVSEHGGAITGIAVGRQVLDEAEILNLAVRKSERR